jgi:insulysin
MLVCTAAVGDAMELQDYNDATEIVALEEESLGEATEEEAGAMAKALGAAFTDVAPDPLLPKIQTPSLQKQVVAKMRLPNRMGVYIVSDPNLEKSAMAVGISVGSWKDPDSALGMAHFIEHMMFMGTKQHPKPGGFDDFLAANGATMSNAQTGSQDTCYAFAVPHDVFKEGVSRFAEFFTDPLFDSKGAAKEMHAVNQEFEMHKDQDGYRAYMVENQLANPKHPKSRFTIGNLKTLGKVQNEELVDWYTKHYSSNLMHIAIYTALPVDEIKPLVAEHFARVVDRNYTNQKIDVPVLDPVLAKKIVHIKPLKQVRTVELQWELPPAFAHKRLSKPDRLVGAILGDEGPGSVLATLRKKHLALGLSAGASNSGRDNALFSIDLSLTEAGLKQWQDIVSLIFKSLSEVKAAGFKKYMWDESLQRDLNSWRFQARTSSVFDSAMGQAEAMMREPLATFPRTLSIIQEYDPTGAMTILDSLKPDDVHVEIIGDTFPPAGAEGGVKNETFYGAQFAITSVPADVLAKWKTAFSGKGSALPVDFEGEFKLPPPNPYIPSNLTAGTVDPNSPVFPSLPQPKLVVNDTFGRLYHVHDRAFGDPYVSGSIQIKTAAEHVETLGPKATVMTKLFVDCIDESLKTKGYVYRTAGLTTSLSVGKGTNLWLNFFGKVPVQSTIMAAVEMLLTSLKQPFAQTASVDTFEMIRKAVARGYANELKSGPSATASRNMWSKFSNTRTPVEELHAIAQKITHSEVAAFVPLLLSKVSAEGFFFGQLTQLNVENIFAVVKNKMSTTVALTKAEEFVPKMLVLPNDKGPWTSMVHGEARSNATILMVDGGHLGCKDSLALSMLYKVLGQMFFNDLRTKQQTGYVASTYATEVARRAVAMFNVESSWAGPGDLLGRFETFIGGVLVGLKNGTVVPQAKLDMLRKAMLATYAKPIQNVAAMGSMLESIVRDYDSDFDVMKKRKANLESLTLADIARVGEMVLSPINKRRFASLYSPNGNQPDAVPPGYVPFVDGKTGVFTAKPKYQCEVCTNATGCVKKKRMKKRKLRKKKLKKKEAEAELEDLTSELSALVE